MRQPGDDRIEDQPGFRIGLARTVVVPKAADKLIGQWRYVADN